MSQINNSKEQFSSMSLTHHLKELRIRVIYCLIFYTIGFLICWYFGSDILSLITQPISPYLKYSSGQLVFTAPMDEFMSRIKVALFGSAVLNFPFFMFHMWKFCASGLYSSERKILIFLNVVGSLLFFLGVLFIYFIVYPLSFGFLMQMGSLIPLISVREYLSFFMLTTFVFGLLFEIPLIIIGLVKLQLITPSQLKKGRKYAFVLLAVVAALVTPPDVLSMLFLLLPLYLLYEGSIFATAFLRKGQ